MLRQADVDLRAGKLDRARHSYTRVLEVAQGHETDARLGLARVARARGDKEAARQELDAAVAGDPSSARANLALADFEWESGDKDAARRRYQQILVDFKGREIPARVHQRAGAKSDEVEPRGAHDGPSTAPDAH